jgi:hypothetical protein
VRNGEPRVWGAGDITIAVGMHGYRIWVGVLLIDYVEEIKIIANSQGNPQVQIRFPQSHERETQLRIEENVRVAKTMSWIQVV